MYVTIIIVVPVKTSGMVDLPMTIFDVLVVWTHIIVSPDKAEL